MDFIRNLFTLFQRLQDIIREGQKRGDVPGMAMALVREVRGSDRDADGQGDGPAGRALLPVPRDFTVGQFKFDADGDGHSGTDGDLFLVIRDGAGPSGGNPLMAAWGHLGDEQVRELVVYVRSLEGAKAD